MGPISKPSILAFLHYLTIHHPAIETVSDLPRKRLEQILAEFEASRGLDYGNSQHFWRLFVSDPISGGLPLRKRAAFSIPRLRFVNTYKSIAADPLRRYRSIPNKAIFFYTSEDIGLINYLETHWDAIHETSGDVLDIYDYAIRISSSQSETYQSFVRNYILSLSNLSGLSIENLLDCGLPCLFVWSLSASVVIPLADVASDVARLRARIRKIIKILSHSGSLTDWQVDELETIGFDDISFGGIKPRTLEPIPCDVFISYTRSQLFLVESICKRLHLKSLRPWFDRDIRCGDRFRNRIKVQMEYAAASLICLTPKATESPWVLFEAQYAARLGTAVPILFGIDEPFAPIASLHHFKFDAAQEMMNSSAAERLFSTVEAKALTRRRNRNGVESRRREMAAITETEKVLRHKPNSGQALRQLRRLRNWKRSHPNLDHGKADRLLDQLSDFVK